MTATRSTISFTKENWKHIEKANNRSQVVNSAIKYYFESQKFLEEKEKEFILSEFKKYSKTKKSYSFKETFDD
jgi:hypothetical protein